MFFFSFALAGQFLTAEPHCSSEVQRLSCWSQSVNQLSSRYISRSINIGSTEGDLPEPSWGSPAQCHHRHLGITPHNSQHGVWGLRPLCIASLSGNTLISTPVVVTVEKVLFTNHRCDDGQWSVHPFCLGYCFPFPLSFSLLYCG